MQHLSTTHHIESNRLEIPLIAHWMMILFIIGLGGLFFVYLKNQQHLVGEQTRIIEQKIMALQAHHDALKAQIATRISRPALQRKLNENYLQLVSITEADIVHVTSQSTSSGQEHDSLRYCQASSSPSLLR